MSLHAKYETTLEKDDDLFTDLIGALPAQALDALRTDQPHGLEHIDIELRGTHSPATTAYFDSHFGNYLPGDPEQTEITGCVVQVKVGGKSEDFDVTSALSGNKLGDLVARVSEHTDLTVEDPNCEPDYDEDRYRYGF